MKCYKISLKINEDPFTACPREKTEQTHKNRWKTASLRKYKLIRGANTLTESLVHWMACLGLTVGIGLD